MDLDACDLGQGGCQLMPDPGRNPLERRQLEAGDFIEKMVVEFLAHGHDFALEILEMPHKTGFRRRLALQPDDDAKRMPMHPAIGMAFLRIGKEMGGVEMELFVDAGHGIPISLCVCRLNRHFGCARQ